MSYYRGRDTKIAFIWYRCDNILPREVIRLICESLPTLLTWKHTTIYYDYTVTQNHEPYERMDHYWPDLSHPSCAVLWFRVSFDIDATYIDPRLRSWLMTYLETRFRRVCKRYTAAWTSHWRIITYATWTYPVGYAYHLCLLMPGSVTRKRNQFIQDKLCYALGQSLGHTRHIVYDKTH